ncbi:penicillin-binding protein 1A [Marinobacterium jannaschii]|uniref:penicillin-binding protein 1A n=1 Tax=Marinobacterium jannaschii TaxID=64970 RepID=UPI00047FFDF9|nr:penicillin-binding protein 1A [Marinobacterium jannaschii]
MRILLSLLKFFTISGLLVGLLGVGALVAAYYHYSPKLPDVETLREIKFQTPLRIYSRDEKLIAEFGEKRRTPVTYDQIPPRFVEAVLAAEDTRFFEHPGIDIKGLARAAYQLASSGRIQSGGSTITMQVAKNFFLSREKKFSRKFMEILLAIRIEQELSKEEIFELYVNKIFLGHRSYGIQAAANVYYGNDISELTTAQLAMIAGLPKAPSAYNPLANPSRALERRNWILSRMHSLAFIEDQEYEEARNAPVTAKKHSTEIELDARYVAEMVRAELFEQYGDDLYTEGFRVITNIDSQKQAAANQALRDGLLAYSERHGYHGPEKRFEIEALGAEQVLSELQAIPTFSNIEPAVVLELKGQGLRVLRKNGESTELPWDSISWARRFKSVNSQGPRPAKAADIVNVGDVIRIRQDDKAQWRLTQIPRVQGAFVALEPKDGAIQALVGGFNFEHNKFNRATQALRQPGSNFKPFIYTAALDNGYTPATTINDAPVVFHDKNLESSWRPENYSRKFYGPTRLREALYKSRNLVSIRILRSLGINKTLDYIQRFGFNKEQMPRNLTLSLGAADLTPMQLVTGYARLANGGFAVDPYLIKRIEDQNGETIFSAAPATVCDGCQYSDPENPPQQLAEGAPITNLPLAERILEPQVAYLIYNIMQDVIKRGTGRKAQRLGREDLAGKTGTTNDQKDAWFSGFNRDIVASAWVGYDKPQHLGRREFGSTAALPIWIDFMQVALKGQPASSPLPPEGIVSVRIDPATGLLAYPGQPGAVFEYFREENVPQAMAQIPGAANQNTTTDDIF